MPSDWLRGLETTPQETAPAEPVVPAVEKAEAVPDWLASLQPIAEEPSAPVAEEKPVPPEAPVPPSTFEWTSEPEIEKKAEPGVEQSFADFLASLGQETALPSEPTPAIPGFQAGLPTTVEPEAQPTQEEYRLPSFLGEAEVAMPVAPEPAAQPEIPLPAFLSGAPVEEKPVTPSEPYPVPSFLETPAPPTPVQPITPIEEWTPPEMPPAPAPVETVPPIVVETPPARVEKVAKVPKPKRALKGSERLEQARHSRDANDIVKALAEYDYLVQRAPRLIRDVIDDLEVLVQRIDIPLDAHRILGDAYTRNDRLSDALEQYRFVMEHSPKASE